MGITEYYFFLKKQYSVRTFNALEKIENVYRESGYRHIEENFVKKVFIEPFDYSTISGLGAMTMNDILDIKDKILQKCGILPSEDSYNPILKLFNNTIDNKEYNSLYEDGEIIFFRLFIQYLFRVSLKERYRLFFLYYFFENEIKDENELATKLDITRERVRPLKNKFSDQYFPESIAELRNVVPEVYQKFCDTDNLKNYLIPYGLEDVVIDGIVYKPNKLLVEIIYSVIYEDEYKLLNSIMSEHHNRNSFKDFSALIFLSKSFIKKYLIEQLIDWLDEQLYEFALDEFEYNFEVLIKRFYEEETDIVLPKEILKDIIILLGDKRRDNWDDLQEKINRRKHKKEKTAFIDCIYNFIKEKGESVKTEEILNHLQANNYEFDKVQLLTLLNKLKNQFYSIGYGHWNIKTAGSEDKTTGTIRAFVYKILMENKDPLHISKIVSIINEERAVNERSVLTNLKVDEYKRFVFLNCTYIGLKDKEYDDYWHNLPKLNPGRLISEMKDAIIDDNFFDFMEEKYGYPKEHIKYLMKNKDQ